MKRPISEHWKSLSIGQAWSLVAIGIVLEGPIRWVVRPDIPYMYPGNPWFNLPLRISVELGLVLIVIILAWALRIQLAAIGVSLRKWTRLEWIALVIVGTIELAVVIIVAGERWPRLFAAGFLGPALLWAFGEFWFGFNQEFVFRGPLMSGLLRIKTPLWATILNTFVFVIGPLHGPGLLRMMPDNPGGAGWMLAGVIATGLFFSWLRYHTDNVILCGALHGLVNGFLNGAGFAIRAYLQ